MKKLLFSSSLLVFTLWGFSQATTISVNNNLEQTINNSLPSTNVYNSSIDAKPVPFFGVNTYSLATTFEPAAGGTPSGGFRFQLVGIAAPIPTILIDGGRNFDVAITDDGTRVVVVYQFGDEIQTSIYTTERNPSPGACGGPAVLNECISHQTISTNPGGNYQFVLPRIIIDSRDRVFVTYRTDASNNPPTLEHFVVEIDITTGQPLTHANSGGFNAYRVTDLAGLTNNINNMVGNGDLAIYEHYPSTKNGPHGRTISIALTYETATESFLRVFQVDADVIVAGTAPASVISLNNEINDTRYTHLDISSPKATNLCNTSSNPTCILDQWALAVRTRHMNEGTRYIRVYAADQTYTNNYVTFAVTPSDLNTSFNRYPQIEHNFDGTELSVLWELNDGSGNTSLTDFDVLSVELTPAPTISYASDISRMNNTQAGDQMRPAFCRHPLGPGYIGVFIDDLNADLILKETNMGNFKTSPNQSTIDVSTGETPKKLEVYPNPFEDHITFEISDVKELRVLNGLNQVLYAHTFGTNTSKGTDQHRIELNNLPSGYYFLESVNLAGEVHKQALVKL